MLSPNSSMIAQSCLNLEISSHLGDRGAAEHVSEVCHRYKRRCKRRCVQTDVCQGDLPAHRTRHQPGYHELQRQYSVLLGCHFVCDLMNTGFKAVKAHAGFGNHLCFTLSGKDQEKDTPDREKSERLRIARSRPEENQNQKIRVYHHVREI